MDTNKLWLYLVICTVIGSLIGLPRFLTYLGRLAIETRQELDVVSSGSAYDGMIDAQEEVPTQPLPVLSVEETDQTYAILRARAYTCCLETLLMLPGTPEDVRRGV